jgi:hypothetical protein
LKEFPESHDIHEQDVWLMARRMALLYYHMATAIMKSLGEEEGARHIEEAIMAYGRACGKRVREGVIRRGLPTVLDNYGQIPDLPSKGWRGEKVVIDGRETSATTFCPLAATWKELGAERIGRLYCLVDLAKYGSYSEDIEAFHIRNILDGDPCCAIHYRRAGDCCQGE